MIRSELVARLQKQNPDLAPEGIERLVETFFQRIATALVDGHRVEIRDFGVFTTRDRPGRAARNPRDGTPITLAPSRLINFREGRNVRDRINAA